ncbi:MAG: tRNA pseudouridine(13) synthase TruD [Myxococcales bacterium]|nr:tRNA pseudouridine(13) synthase TruD [Myxococcales bacterium]
MVSLPYLTHAVAPVSGTWREESSDFLVDEIAAYNPSGTGEHLFVRFEKREINTADAVRMIAKAIGADPGGAGFAGLKDRHAITTQWASFFHPSMPNSLDSLALPGIRVLEFAPHPHKLRTGHLHGNRFRIRLRGAAQQIAMVTETFRVLEQQGVPNYYGAQRFGHNNLARAKDWLIENRPPPRSRFDRKLLVSVLQSSVFNDVLSQRIDCQEMSTAIEGDLLRKENSGGMFTTSDLSDAQQRVMNWEISPTGPMVGLKMRWPEADALAREKAILAQSGIDDDVLNRFRRAGQGTRRPLRVKLGESRVSVHAECSNDLDIEFVLPSGSYATAVMREVLKSD